MLLKDENRSMGVKWLSYFCSTCHNGGLSISIVLTEVKQQRSNTCIHTTEIKYAILHFLASGVLKIGHFHETYMHVAL